MTVHNLAFQGIFPAGDLAELNLLEACFSVHGVEYFGRISYLKAGLFYADRLTTVSPTYAREIHPDQGMALDGLLRRASIWSASPDRHGRVDPRRSPIAAGTMPTIPLARPPTRRRCRSASPWSQAARTPASSAS